MINAINTFQLLLFEIINFIPTKWKMFVIKYKDCRKTPLILIILLMLFSSLFMNIGLTNLNFFWSLIVTNLIILTLMLAPFVELLKIYGLTTLENRKLTLYLKRNSKLNNDYIKATSKKENVTDTKEELLKDNKKMLTFNLDVKPKIIKGIFQLYFEKYFKKINYLSLLMSCTNFNELTDNYSTYEYKSQIVQLSKEEREDLVKFINYLKEHKILLVSEKQNSTINSVKSIFNSLTQNSLVIENLNFNTFKKDIPRNRFLKGSKVKQELNSYLDKHNLLNFPCP